MTKDKHSQYTETCSQTVVKFVNENCMHSQIFLLTLIFSLINLTLLFPLHTYFWHTMNIMIVTVA